MGKIATTSALQAISRRFGQATSLAPIRTYRLPGHEAFQGYYDIAPFNRTGSAILAHTALAKRRHLRPDDSACIGYFDRNEGQFTSLARTSLWCWQIGARLRWWPGHDYGMAFNALAGSQPSFCYVEPGMEPVAIADRPLFDVSSGHDRGLALNFGRLAYARPGYGYVALADPTLGIGLPDTDGIWIVDIGGGENFIASTRDIAALTPAAKTQGFHYLNAASFNPSGEYFSVLHKRLEAVQRVDSWEGRAVVGAVGGSDLHVVPLEGRPSHYWWLDDNRIAYTVVPSRHPNQCEFVLYDIRTRTIQPLHPGAPHVDGHLSYHTSGRWIVDGYPSLRGEQPLHVLEPDGSATELGAIRADPRYHGEWRCDLHPRWTPDGEAVVIDSSHEGHRTISEVAVPPLSR